MAAETTNTHQSLYDSYSRIAELTSDADKRSDLGVLHKIAERGKDRYEHPTGGMFPEEFADSLIKLMDKMQANEETARLLSSELMDERSRMQALLKQMQ